MQAQIHAPRVGYAYNLLDNSDFRNPVNQRGQTSYTAAGYTIDRWAVTSGLTVGGAGVTSPGGNYLYQMITQAAIPAGTYTGAMGLADGTVICGSAIYTASDDACMIITNEDLAMYLLCQGTVVQLAISTITEKTIVWAALYEGAYTADTLPPYVSKGYAAELAECQRYYFAFCSNDYKNEYVPVELGFGDSFFRFIIGISQFSMRSINPSIVGDVQLYAPDTGWTNVDAYCLPSAGGFIIRMATPKTLVNTGQNVAIMRGLKALSADL